MKVLNFLIIVLFFVSCKSENTKKEDPSVLDEKTAATVAENGVELTPEQLKNANIQVGKAETRTLKDVCG